MTLEQRNELKKKLAGLMQAAADSNHPENMRALAAAIAAPIKAAVDQKEIASMLLTRHDLPVGELATYQLDEEVIAYWMSNAGDVNQSLHTESEVTFPFWTLAAKPTMKKSTLKHGNVGDLMDKIDSAAKNIVKKLNSRAVSLISAAVPAAQTVEISGGVLTKDGLNEAMATLEDQELRIKAIVLRGSRINDMRTQFDLDPVTDREFIEKGVVAMWNGAMVINSAAVDSDEVLILGEEEAGKMAVRDDLASEEAYAGDLKVAALVSMELAMGVTRSEVLSKCVILPAE